MIYEPRTLEELHNIAEDFLNTLPESETGTVVALSGDLGAGKTAFSQEIGKALGVAETMQSPTFVIEKIYNIDYKQFKKLIHIDAYRLEKDSELLHLGWREIIGEKENLILIEWPERVAGIIPEDAFKIQFEFIDESSRRVTIPEIAKINI
jgi:tRNA threonylcarbamoyladenosine biosynthesis protein TsaE